MATVTFARVVIPGANLGINSARVLPDLAAVVPMESNLRKQTCYLAGRTFRELNPNPFPDNLGHAAKEGCFPLKHSGVGNSRFFLRFSKSIPGSWPCPAFETDDGRTFAGADASNLLCVVFIAFF